MIPTPNTLTPYAGDEAPVIRQSPVGGGRDPLFVVVPGILAYLAVGIGLWQLTHDVSWELVYVLGLALVVVLLLYTRLRSDHAALGSEHAITHEARLAAEIDQLTAGMVSLALYLVHEPSHDNQHEFQEVHEEYVISGNDGTYNWELQGTNVGPEISAGLVLKFSGDSPLDSVALDVRATDCSTRATLRTKLLADEPFLKVLDIQFAEPLSAGAAFHVRLSIGWPNSFPQSRKDDYVFFVFGHYAVRPIGKLFGRLVCDVPVAHAELWTSIEGRLARDPRRPRVAEALAGHHALEWSTEGADRLVLLRFSKQLPGRGERG